MLASWWWQGVVPNVAESVGGAVLLLGVTVTAVRGRRTPTSPRPAPDTTAVPPATNGDRQDLPLR
jgi:hypothetical protein